MAQREADTRYRALFELSPSLSVSLDRRGTIDTVNAHGASKLGYDAAELVGKPIFDLVYERDRLAFREQIAAASRSPNTVASGDVRMVRRKGSTLWTRASLRSIQPTDSDEQFLLVCKDVTEHKKTEERLLDYRERLRLLTSELVLAEEKERRRIAKLLHDDVGHSLALAQIRLGKLVVEDRGNVGPDLAPVRELIAEAIEGTRSLTAALSSPVLYELGLEAALESVADDLAKATGMRFVFESDGEPRPLSEDKRILLFRFARELLLNAAKHAQAQNVTLALRTVEDQVQVRVVDDGIGFHVTEVMRPTGRGVGHGLLAAAEQIRSLGGTLQVSAEPGRGTTCLIMVPLGDDPT